MAVSSSPFVSGDTEPSRSSASTLASEKAGYLSAGEEERDEAKAVKHDGVPSSAADEDVEYPTGFKMFFIVVALVMSIFLLSLDMVCRCCFLPLA